MQRFAGRFLSLIPLVCGAVVLASLAGCGGTKKKPPMTFAERLKKAKADATPGGPARDRISATSSWPATGPIPAFPPPSRGRSAPARLRRAWR